MNKNYSLEQILDLPMLENSAEAGTIREYFTNMMSAIWEEGEGFSGKRPFGNSGWEHEVYAALVKAEAIDGTFDEDGWLDDCDDEKGRLLIAAALRVL